MVPMTALRMMDIHSNATRLRPKPILPNVAKITRMNIRRQKRMITWADLSSCGRFGSCAKIRDSDGCACYGLVCANGSIFKWWNRTELGEIIAANRLELITSCLRYRRPARLSRRFNLPKRFDVGADNCERKAGMGSLDRLVQPLREFALPGHGAVPLAFIVGDAAYLPKRQLQID